MAAPRPVGELGTFLARLREAASGTPIALGVDFPLGLPRAYVQTHALEAADFPAFLRGLAQRPRFFEVCAVLEEISADRPFYPHRGAAGMTRAAHAAALGFDGPRGLSRLCDRATCERPAGAPLFWTLGANQTGKAAITAWRDFLLPALAAEQPVRLWPFEGGLLSLLSPGTAAIAETYPAEALRQLGLRMGGSKRRQTDRAALGPALREAMAKLNAVPGPTLKRMITDGFGADAAAEDRFDCVLGVLSVLTVLTGRRPDVPPPDPWLTRWEGWVLGQISLPIA